MTAQAKKPKVNNDNDLEELVIYISDETMREQVETYVSITSSWDFTLNVWTSKFQSDVFAFKDFMVHQIHP